MKEGDVKAKGHDEVEHEVEVIKTINLPGSPLHGAKVKIGKDLGGGYHAAEVVSCREAGPGEDPEKLPKKGDTLGVTADQCA